MLAYVNLVQAREKEIGCDVLTHQKWSGAGYIDGILGSIQSGSSGSRSMGEGNTEAGKLSPNINHQSSLTVNQASNVNISLNASTVLDKKCIFKLWR